LSDRSPFAGGGGADDELPAHDTDAEPPDADLSRAAPTPAANPSTPESQAGEPSAHPRPPGAAVFSLEGRAAPGLYLVGWLATVLGLAILAAVILSAPGGLGAAALLLISAVLVAVGLVAAAGAQAIERRERGDAYAGPSPFLVFAASLPIALPVAIVALRLGELGGIDPSSPLGSVIGQAALILGLLALVRFLVVGPRALSWSDMSVRWRGAARAAADIGWGAVLAVPVILATAVLAEVLVKLLGTTPDSPLPSAHDPGGIALNALAAVIIAPIGEELFFRGFSLTAWERSLGSRRALIRASLFFAFVHVLTVGGATFSDAAAKALIGFAVRIPVAFALGWVFVARRSIFASMGLHATFNGLLLLIAAAATTP
jgi:membrane protease YdiL (CAAX protease family)